MASITRFLADTLKLTVNAAKSAVAQPWTRKFLGYSLTRHKSPKLRIAPTSLKRLDDKIREVLQGASGRSLTTVIDQLNPILRGWMAYFQLAGSGTNCAASCGDSGNVPILAPRT